MAPANRMVIREKRMAPKFQALLVRRGHKKNRPSRGGFKKPKLLRD